MSREQLNDFKIPPVGPLTGNIVQKEYYRLTKGILPFNDSAKCYTARLSHLYKGSYVTTIRIGINGFGRMGRLGLRAGWQRPEYQIVHVNEISGDTHCMAHLLEFDSVHGRWDSDIQVDSEGLTVGGRSVGYSSAEKPGDVDWRSKGIDLVIDCTARFKTETSWPGPTRTEFP